LWWASIYTSVYNPIPCTRTSHKCAFTKRDSMFFTVCLIFGTMVVFWSIPSTIKDMKKSGVIMADLLNNQ
jgi:hypothetical protein